MPNPFDIAEAQLQGREAAAQNPFDVAEQEMKKGGGSNGPNPFDIAEAEVRRSNRKPVELQDPLPTSALSIGADETVRDLRQAGAQFVRGAAGMAASVPESLGILAYNLGGRVDSAGNPIGIEDVELYQAGKAIRRGAQSLVPVDESRPHKFAVDTLGQGAGSMAGAIAGGMIGQAAKLPGWLGVAATGATSQGADAFDEAKAKGASDQDAFTAFLLNAGAGTSEAFPIGKWLDKINRGTDGAIRRAIKEGSEELIQEVFQQVSQNVIAQQIYDPERPWMEGVPESGAAGLTLGTLGGLLFKGHAPHAVQPRWTGQAAPTIQNIPSPAAPSVPGVPGPLAVTRPEVPELTGPVAVFTGPKGEEIRVQIGSAGLDGTKEYAMRVWPGAEFKGVEALDTPPPGPSPVPVPVAPQQISTINPEGGVSGDQVQPSQDQGQGQGLLSPPEAQPDAVPVQAEPAPELQSTGVQPNEQSLEPAPPADPVSDQLSPEASVQGAGRLGVTSEETRVEPPSFPPGRIQGQPGPTPEELQVATKRVGKGISVRKIFNAQTEAFGPDILSFIVDAGGMVSKSAARRIRGKEWMAANGSLFDDAPKLSHQHHSIIYNPDGTQMPDQVAEAAKRAGLLTEGTVPELWEAIAKASAARVGNVQNAKREEAWIKAEAKEHQAWQKATAKGELRVSASELNVGDELEVDGERVEVVALDPDTMEVTVKDGRKFGTQKVDADAVLHVEKLTQAQESTADDFAFDAPESIDEQKQREALKLNTPESVAAVILEESSEGPASIAAEFAAQDAHTRLKAQNSGGMRIRPNRRGEAGSIINPATIIGDLLKAGASVLRAGGRGMMAKGQWIAKMVRNYGERIQKYLDGVWVRLARIGNQQANGVNATAQGHINAIESLAGKTNVPLEQHPVYTDETLKRGKPSLLTKASPLSEQIKILGGEDLLRAKRRRDILEATQAAAVQSQSERLWQELIQSARGANPMAKWKLPDWLIATPRARAFKERALHIAARLNATGRDANGSFQFNDFVMRAGSMTVAEATRNGLQPGGQVELDNPTTGEQEVLTVGPLVTPPTGGPFYQLLRPMEAATQREIYDHFQREYPEMIWFLDMFIDPALAETRTVINGIEVPAFNRFAAAAMMAQDNPNFTPLTAYTPDVLVTRSLVGAIRSALSFHAGTRSPGRKYKSGTSREGGHVRDLLSGFNIRTWQMLAEKSRKEWRDAVLKSATPIVKGQVPNGWVKLETGMDDLWQAVKRLRNWHSPEDWRPLKQSEIDELDAMQESLKPNQRIAKNKEGRYFLVTTLFPETEARMTEGGYVDEERDYKAFFGEALRLRGRQLMLPQALVKLITRQYVAQVEHGILYRMGAWAVRNSTGLWLAAPTTYVSNVLTNDLFTLAAATRRILSGVASGDRQDIRFAWELMVGEGFKWFPGLRRLRDRRFRDTVEQVLPDGIFSNQTALADLKVRLSEDASSYLRKGEIASAVLQLMRYGNIDIVAKQRMAYAWLKAMAVTNARRAGLRGAALEAAVDRYLQNPPIDDRAKAVEIAGFELLNYADSPPALEDFTNSDFSKVVIAFPRFGYNYIYQSVKRAAAVRDLIGKVPRRRRAEAFADLVTFILFPAGGAGLLAQMLFGDDDDEARKLFGTSQIKVLGYDGQVTAMPMDRSLVTANRINLTGWARQLGLGDPNREDDFWMRVRSYPIINMSGAAVLALNDYRKYGVREGALGYMQSGADLASDFFSVGLAVKGPDKVLQVLRDRSNGKNPPQMMTDPYATRVPLLAYLTDQTLDTFLPGNRQADMIIRWMDPVQRRRTANQQLGFQPSMWDAARVGHWTGLLDRLLSPGMESTLPAEGPVSRGYVEPQSITPTQKVSELLGFNVRSINRRAYEEALKLNN